MAGHSHFVSPNRLPYSNVPVIGPWISRINRVIQILSSPCSPSPEIWVEAAFAALPTLLVGIFGPSPTDAAITRVGFGGGPLHGRGTKFHFHVTSIIQLAETELKTPGWVRFPLGALGARLLWYFAIADATTEFLVNWTSLAYQWTGCRFPASAWGYCATPGGAIWAPPLDGPIFPSFTDHASNIFLASNLGVETPAGYSPSVGWSADFDQNVLPPTLRGEGSVELYDGDTGTVLDSHDLGGTGNKSGSIARVVQGYLQGTAPHFYGLRWNGTGWVYLTSPRIDVLSANIHDGVNPFHVKLK